MDLTISTIIGDFILIAGSFPFINLFSEKNMLGEIFPASWMNVLKRFLQILMVPRKPKKAEELANQREAELAGSRTEAKTIIENAKGTAEKKVKADILAEAKLEAGR